MMGNVDLWCNIADTLASLLEPILIMVFVTTFMPGRLSRRQFTIAVVGVLLDFIYVEITNHFAIYSTLKGWGVFIIAFIILLLIYQKRVFRILLYTMIMLMVFVMMEYILVALGTFVTHMPFEYFMVNSWLRFTLIIVGKILQAAWVLLFYFNFRNAKPLQRSSMVMILAMTTGITMLAMYMFENFMEIKVVSASEAGVFAALLIMEFLILFSVVMMDTNRTQREEIALTSLYGEMLHYSLEEERQSFEIWRTRLHDYKNRCIYIRELLESGEYDQVKALMDAEIGVLKKQSLYVESGYVGVDAIVNTKSVYAEGRGIHMRHNISLPENLKLSDTIMASVLGNLIDNAIRAAQESEEKMIGIDIKYMMGAVCIRISNSKSGEVVDFYSTTKEDKAMHGIGRHSVENDIHQLGGNIEYQQDAKSVTVTVMFAVEKSD